MDVLLTVILHTLNEKNYNTKFILAKPMVISVLKSVLLGEIFVRSKVMENENNSSFLLMNG